MPRIGKVLRRDAERSQDKAVGDTNSAPPGERIKLEQLAAADAVVENFRQYVTSSPDVSAGSDSHLADILAARSRILVALDFHAEALLSVEEELGIRRRVLAADPSVDLGPLAEVLILRSRVLAALNRSAEARADAIEARAVLQQAIVVARRKAEEAKKKVFDGGQDGSGSGINNGDGDRLQRETS